jgi:hypothetical protein
MVKPLYRKLTSIFLGIVALQILVPFIFSCSILAIRHQQKKLLVAEHSAEFIQIAFPETGLPAISPDSEFMYNGILYDITLKAPRSSPDQHQFSNIAPFALLYYEEAPIFDSICRILREQRHYNHYQCSMHSAFAAVFIPPPRFTC